MAVFIHSCLKNSSSKVKLPTRQSEKKPRDLVFKQSINQAPTVLQHRTCKAFHIKTGATQNGTVATSYEKTEQFPESHKCGTRQWRKMINQQLQKSIDIFEESRKRSWRESYNSGQTPATNTLQATHTHSVGEKTQCTEQMTTNATNNLLHFTAHHQHDSKTPLPRQTSSFCQKLRAYIWALCTLSNMSSSHQH